MLGLCLGLDDIAGRRIQRALLAEQGHDHVLLCLGGLGRVGKPAPEQVAENIETIVKRIESVLEQGPLNVRSIFVKTTMGPAVRLE